MIRRLTLAGLALVSSTALALADTYPRNPDIDVEHYLFRLTLTDASDEITGEATITVRCTRSGVTELAVDLVALSPERQKRGMAVDEVSEGGAPLEFVHANDRLIVRFRKPSERDERRVVTIVYHGVPADGLITSKNVHGDRTFFADNFADRARHWIPTIDHPSDKATCEFVVIAPDRYRVIATGARVEETDQPDGRRLTHWRTSVPVATYNMVIGVARFATQHVERVDGVPVETWVYPQDRNAGFFDFARAGRVLEFFSFRVGPYPYEKLASVQSRTRYGGMENAGNIFYGESLVTGTRGVENTETHEIAHQWFGDAVTESDWNHVWLSEGFATYFTHVFNEWTYGHDRMVEGLTRDRRAIVDFSRRNPDARVVDPRVPVSRILSPYTYEKGGWVLHMLRRLVGNERFWAGIRAYYREYRNRNALTEDFRRVMEEASGANLERFFQQWIYEPGHPRLRATWTYDGRDKVASVTVDQVQEGKPFAFSLDLGFTFPDGARQVETIDIDDRSRTVTIPLETPPTALSLDPDTWLLAETEIAKR
jgi:aminopeptidase N